MSDDIQEVLKQKLVEQTQQLVARGRPSALTIGGGTRAPHLAHGLVYRGDARRVSHWYRRATRADAALLHKEQAL